MPRTKQIHPRNLRGMLLSSEEKGLFGKLGDASSYGRLKERVLKEVVLIQTLFASNSRSNPGGFSNFERNKQNLFLFLHCS